MSDRSETLAGPFCLAQAGDCSSPRSYAKFTTDIFHMMVWDKDISPESQTMKPWNCKLCEANSKAIWLRCFRRLCFAPRIPSLLGLQVVFPVSGSALLSGSSEPARRWLPQCGPSHPHPPPTRWKQHVYLLLSVCLLYDRHIAAPGHCI